MDVAYLAQIARRFRENRGEVIRRLVEFRDVLEKIRQKSSYASQDITDVLQQIAVVCFNSVNPVRSLAACSRVHSDALSIPTSTYLRRQDYRLDLVTPPWIKRIEEYNPRARSHADIVQIATEGIITGSNLEVPSLMGARTHATSGANSTTTPHRTGLRSERDFTGYN